MGILRAMNERNNKKAHRVHDHLCNENGTKQLYRVYMFTKLSMDPPFNEGQTLSTMEPSKQLKNQ